MHKILIIIVVSLLAISVNAQYAGYTVLNDLTKFKAGFSEAAQRTTSIKSGNTTWRICCKYTSSKR